MPLLDYKTQLIEIEVSDRIIADTVIKQKAKFVSLNHTQNEFGSIATITVLVTLYASSNGSYGDELKGSGFSPYSVVLVADNNTIVNAETGAILFVRTNEFDELWKAKAELEQELVMFQGDFFEMLRDTQAIKIGDMIRMHINQANQFGKFN